jgi:hypothetical protein
MISLEELQSEIKRLELLKNNTDNPEEIFISDILISNLSQLNAQLVRYVETDEFKKEVERRKGE